MKTDMFLFTTKNLKMLVGGTIQWYHMCSILLNTRNSRFQKDLTYFNEHQTMMQLHTEETLQLMLPIKRLQSTRHLDDIDNSRNLANKL